MLHTAHGYWLDEAGAVDPRPALAGDLDADFVVIGGGYTGMWAAWSLLERAPGARVALLEAGRCGHGPSGRNGGFLNSFWYAMGRLRARHGEAAALAIARAGAESVPGIEQWCTAQGVDAWVRRAGHLVVSTAPAFDDAWRRSTDACAAAGAAGEYEPLAAEAVRRRCDSPIFRSGALMRTAGTVQPARLALGLRARLIDRGALVHEFSPVRRLDDRGVVVVAETPGGRVRAGVAVLALGPGAASVGPLERRLTVASSHIVLTEPVPDVLESVGWTGGESITDARAYVHYLRTTPDGRIAFGWGGGRMAFGARLRGRIEVDPAVAAEVRRHLLRFFPVLEGRRVTHAWGGPIDISPAHLPAFGTLAGGRTHYGFGYTGNGVGPSYLGGRILASLALDSRDELTRLALVEPASTSVPPEPLRWIGGNLIRTAFLRKEAAEERGGRAGAVTELVTGVPARLGVHIGR